MKTKIAAAKSPVPSSASEPRPSPGSPPKSSTPTRRTATAEEISARARRLWEKNGSPEGRDLEFWFEAERQLGAGAGRQTKQEDAFADREVIFNEDGDPNSPVNREIQGKAEPPDRRSQTAL